MFKSTSVFMSDSAVIPMWILDVFCTGPFTGNQLAVFHDAQGRLSTDQMQNLAREMNFSETTFIIGDLVPGGPQEVRIFTPAEEVPFAGHPTLGTAHVLWKELGMGPTVQGGALVLRERVGDIPVELLGIDYWMTQVEPVFGSAMDRGSAARALRLKDEDISEGLPVLQVSTGLPHIIVPLKDHDALARANPDPSAHAEFVGAGEHKNIMAFCFGGHGVAGLIAEVVDGGCTDKGKGDVVSTRMFALDLGIVEDAATGSGSGCLAAYLYKLGSKTGLFGRSDEGILRVTSEQGYEMGRPSRLLLEAALVGEEIRVRVGGQALTVARGEFEI